MNLILLEPHELTVDRMVTVSDARAAHLINVLKVGPGDHVRIGVLDAATGVGTVRDVASGRVALSCVFDSVPPRPAVDLLLALPRPKVLRRLWAQLAALGVDRIILTNAEKVERHYFDTHVLSAACYRPLLVEGLQQARDTRLPVVSIHRRLKVLIEDELDDLCPSGARLLADPGETVPVMEAVGATMAGERVLLAVGPEGGWNDYERAMLRGRGFHSVGLGPRPLRSDTACIALLTLVHAALDSRT